MASRLARGAIGTARLRPTTTPALSATARTQLVAPLASSTQQTRWQSNVPSEEPKAKAQSLIDALPGNSTVAKTGILAGFAGLSVAAISNEIYVVNEESIVMLALLTTYGLVGYYAAPLYKQWSDGHVNKVKGLLYAARDEHQGAVQKRIDDVKSLGGVVDVTKDLFAVSKETVELEAQAYELQQKTALTAEAKAVLDSWVRYEDQLKQRQQRELASSVIAKIEKELEDPKVLKRILDQSVNEVEKLLSQGAQGQQGQQQSRQKQE